LLPLWVGFRQAIPQNVILSGNEQPETIHSNLYGTFSRKLVCLTTCMTEVEFRRNELLFKEGQICNAIFYISSGFLSTTFFGKMQGIKLRAG
jgi:hypothetical protein